MHDITLDPFVELLQGLFIRQRSAVQCRHEATDLKLTSRQDLAAYQYITRSSSKHPAYVILVLSGGGSQIIFFE